MVAGLILVGKGAAVAIGAASLTAGAPWAMAGAAAFMVAQMVPEIENGIRRKFGRDCASDLCEDLVSLGADLLASPESRGPFTYLQDVLDWISEQPSWLRYRVAGGRQKLARVANGLFSGDEVAEIDDSEPASLIGPPTVDGNLSGIATGPNGATTAVTGTIDTSGNFNVSGRSVTISGDLTNGVVTGGTFQHGTSSGTIAQSGAIPPPFDPQTPESRELPPGTPYLSCSYAYLYSDSVYEREFLGWPVIDGNPSVRLRVTGKFNGRVETRTGRATCSVCTAEGTVDVLTGRGYETISCSQYQMAKDAQWSAESWHLPVPAAQFSCTETGGGQYGNRC